MLNNVVFRDILHIDKLEIPDRKVICLFGESGSGKSTLLKMLNGLLTHDHGEILFQNQSILEYNPIELRRKVVMLGQDPIMFEGTVRDNLLIGLDFSERERVEDAKLLNLLKELELSKSLDDEADKLSGGEKQRVAFARILLMDAVIYLLDEPISALDEGTEHKVMDFMIHRVQQNQLTAIFVTHSKEVAEQYADQIIYMEDINKKEVISS